jgi:site-specific DNA-methyltransferase (adenine-specific)
MDLRQGDCLGENGMRTLADKSIDMVLCDLPYGITANKWDKGLDLEAVFKEYLRVIKDNGAIVLFATLPFAVDLINANRKYFRYDLVWCKERGSDFYRCKLKPIRAHELLLVFYKNKPTYNPQMRQGEPYKNFKAGDANPNGVNWRPEFKVAPKDNTTGWKYPLTWLKVKSYGIRMNNKHPTQKPVALLEWLIKTYTNADEIVLDNTFGSGSTAVACKNTNRRFVGWELDERYYGIALERLGLKDKDTEQS